MGVDSALLRVGFVHVVPTLALIDRYFRYSTLYLAFVSKARMVYERYFLLLGERYSQCNGFRLLATCFGCLQVLDQVADLDSKARYSVLASSTGRESCTEALDLNVMESLMGQS